MHVLVGLPAPVPHAPASLELLRRIAFPEARLDLVHAMPPPIPVGWPAEVVVAAETLLWHTDADGARLLTSLGELADRNRDLGPMDAALLDGSAADVLIDRAEESNCDLIAIDASRKGALERRIAGSTAQSIVIGSRKSVLVARPARHPGPLKVVFATDHSPFAERCAHLLARMAPKGMASITVASAWSESRFATIDSLAGSQAIPPSQAFREALVRRNEMTERVFEPVALHTTSVLVPDEPNAAIQRVVEETGADLLVVGARGHGFVERLALGSVSLHQVLHSTASVLVLR
ncbi:MAG: universal stress protein [Armatimonadota bacterium]